MLIHNTSLQLDTIIPGGTMDYNTGEYKENVSLGEAMMYMAKLTKK